MLGSFQQMENFHLRNNPFILIKLLQKEALYYLVAFLVIIWYINFPSDVDLKIKIIYIRKCLELRLYVIALNFFFVMMCVVIFRKMLCG